MVADFPELVGALPAGYTAQEAASSILSHLDSSLWAMGRSRAFMRDGALNLLAQSPARDPVPAVRNHDDCPLFAGPPGV